VLGLNLGCGKVVNFLGKTLKKVGVLAKNPKKIFIFFWVFSFLSLPSAR